MKNLWTFQKIMKQISKDNKEEKRNEEATKLRKECLKQNKGVHSNPLVDLYHDAFVNGQSIKYPHGITASFGYKSFYYRGQIKDYGSCKSSLNRVLNSTSDSNQKKIIKIINELKIRDFGFELDRLKKIQDWGENIGDIFGFTIAQHFGLPTDIIDVTDNLKIALFFATCIHIKNNKFRPLRKKDLKKYKYGVIYIRNRIDELTCQQLEVFPIGYQPFTRCHKQKGHFVVDTLEDKFDIEKFGFKKVFFKHKLKLSKMIFKNFKEGKVLFSYSTSKDIQNLIENIINSNEHSLTSFEEGYLNQSLISKEKKEDYFEKKVILNLLKENNISIVEEKLFFDVKTIQKLDREWDLKKFENKEKIVFGYRKVIVSEE